MWTLSKSDLAVALSTGLLILIIISVTFESLFMDPLQTAASLVIPLFSPPAFSTLCFYLYACVSMRLSLSVSQNCLFGPTRNRREILKFSSRGKRRKFCTDNNNQACNRLHNNITESRGSWCIMAVSKTPSSMTSQLASNARPIWLA